MIDHRPPGVAAPDDPQLADDARLWRSAYIHIPFCRRRCPYCDFAVVAHDELEDLAGTIDRYTDAVIAEIEMEPEWGSLDAINFGGGTPSALPADGIGRMLGALADRFGIAPDAEVSVEANPEDISPTLAAELVDLGCNRISIGAQSFDSQILGVLGRQHTPDAVAASVAALRDAGMRSISIDLIFGATGEDLASWQRSVAHAVELEPDHLSAYSLTVEPGTDLWRSVKRGEVTAPDADHQADQYVEMSELLRSAGYVRYEVSNWSRPGHVCRYNLSTWAQGEYVAFGLGAHGHRMGVRRRNVRRIETYLARIGDGRRPEGGTETVRGFAADQERLMLGLRRAAGVCAGPLGKRLAESDEGVRLIDHGILAFDGARLVVKNPLLTDSVARAVLSLVSEDC